VAGDTSGSYKMIDGVMTKRCTGPSHPGGPVQLPLDRFYVRKGNDYRKGKPVSLCKACNYAIKGNVPETSGLVPIQRIMFVIEELIRRVGKEETKRLMGYGGSDTLTRLLAQKQMQKKFAINAIRALQELRANDIVWHRDSIRHGASQRGRTPKRPTHLRDYYVQASDAEADHRKHRRHTDPEHAEKERLQQRERRRQSRRLTRGY
jgi:hypothetical protein